MIVTLLLGAAALVGTAKEHVLRDLRAGAPRVKVWGGRVLVVVGAWLVVLGAFADTFARVFPV